MLAVYGIFFIKFQATPEWILVKLKGEAGLQKIYNQMDKIYLVGFFLSLILSMLSFSLISLEFKTHIVKNYPCGDLRATERPLKGDRQTDIN